MIGENKQTKNLKPKILQNKKQKTKTNKQKKKKKTITFDNARRGKAISDPIS